MRFVFAVLLGVSLSGAAILRATPQHDGPHCGCRAKNCALPCTTCCAPHECDCFQPNPGR